MIRLIEEGGVTPETLIERAEQPGAARSIWLGLAAQAAFVQGEHFRAISLIRDALSRESDLCSPAISIYWLRENADEEMEKLMRSVGVWDLP